MRGVFLCLVAAAVWACVVVAEPSYPIAIDGQFQDWALVPSYTDPVDDTHDTDHDQPGDIPAYVQHEDVDLVEFKCTHDQNNVYAYFRATGEIGRTSTAAMGKAGRYYVIVTIDVDDNDATGYWLHEGGYYPTTPGYDMNMEVEYYDGAFNTGHYLNHGCTDLASFQQAQSDQSLGFVNVLPGSYDWYTQWVWWDTPQGNPGEIVLPDGQSTIIWVVDKGPVYQGILTIALSADGHEAEMKAPFRGFMNYPVAGGGGPIVEIGKTIDLSFSLEASGELAVGGQWASDTADPIEDYYLAGPSEDSDGDGLPNQWETDNSLDPGSATGDDGADGDPDNDTFTNAQEYAANTDPQDDQSVPAGPGVPAAGPLALFALGVLVLGAALARSRSSAMRRAR